MLNLLFALAGLLAGIGINILADNLPERMPPQRPYCLQCGHVYRVSSWLAAGRFLWGARKCPNCGAAIRLRTIAVELVTMVVFALLPSLVPEPVDAVVNAFFVAALILVIIVDLEHRLILNVVTFPLTALALPASIVVSDEQNTLPLALVGAAVGFVLFFGAYWLGHLLFGPGALGYGDVKLAMAMGAMLGFHRIIFALVMAILLGGLVSALVLVVNRRINRRTFLPYGQYLAIAGIIMLMWGIQIYDWYSASGK
jgi:leader peptidase (prepilin peptidase)/N-methyltransferase